MLRRLGKLSDGDTELPRVVLLRGPTGIGKSWTIQQFYNQLCASADNQYWPKIDADVAAARPLASRKLVGPDPREFVWGAVAVPTFGWWGFNCERLERGVVQSVLDEASLQIDVHWLPLKQRWNQVAGIGQKAKKAWKEISQRMREVWIDEGPAAVLQQFKIEIPFLSPMIGLGWDAGRMLQTKIGNRNDLKNSVATGARSREKTLNKGEELAAVFQGLAVAGLPAVIAIEDIQLMGPELAKMVDVVTKGVSSSATTEPQIASTAPILVVGTVWPEGFQNHELEFPEWVATAYGEGRIEILDLQELGPDALGSVVREYAPDTDNEVIAKVTHAPLNNPYVLKLWLSSASIDRHIRANNGALSMSIGPVLPREAEDVFDSRWKELTPELQDAFRCATAANPFREVGLIPFVPEIINGVLRELGEEFWRDWWDKSGTDEGRESKVFQTAIDTVDWCREEDGMQYFNGSELANTARRQFTVSSYGDGEIAQIQRATLDSIVRWCRGEAGEAALRKTTPAASLLASWYAQLRDELGNPPEAKLSPELVLFLGRALARREDYRTAVRLIEPELSELGTLFGHQSLEFLEVRWDHAVWLGESGRYEEGIKQINSVRPDFETWFPVEAELDQQEARESELSGDLYTTPAKFDHYQYVSDWEDALRREEFQSAIGEQESGPLEGVSEPQRRLSVVSMKLDFYENDQSEWPPPEEIEEWLEQLEQFDLGQADPLVRRSRELLASVYYNCLSDIDDQRELWGDEELVDPGEVEGLYPSGQSVEAQFEWTGKRERRSWYEFLSEEEAHREKYLEGALKQYQLLLEVAMNTDDSVRVTEFTDQIERLKLDRK